MAAKVAEEWLNACSGCEISIVDLGARILDVLALVEFVHIPVLMDHKYYGQLGDQKHLDIPQADVGIITGSIRNEEHMEVAEEMRKKCGIIIALGTCATHGGIPALANSFENESIFQRYYSTETTDKNQPRPHDGIPRLLDRVYALDEKIKVDVHLPGCAPHPDQVFAALAGLLTGNPAVLPDKSVCDFCTTRREGKGKIKKLRRFLQAPEYKSPDEPFDKMRCLLEQGFLCMGAVTKAGCGGDTLVPLHCRKGSLQGCYGPVQHDGNQLLQMLNALASNGIDVDSLPDFTNLLRFSGAHGLLRPVRK